jgi:ribonucleoside-diphosphate reductase alpha chain
MSLIMDKLEDAGVQVSELDYSALNAQLNLVGADGKIQFESDKEAARQFFLQHVNMNTVWFSDLEEKLDYLVDNHYYEEEVIEQYSFQFVKDVFKRAYGYKFRFPTFLGALKYYTAYTLKTFDGKRYLERYEDRVSMSALYLARGNEKVAVEILDEMMSGRFQPATPTFLNAGKAQRGELVSCFLLRIEDNMESISRAIQSSLQLSKRGGGVALNMSNLREFGAPIKQIENQGAGVVPVMKMLEDAFSYANQLGARQGAGAAYLHAHHPDIMRFLDTKRENADEKVRIKSLSLGVVIPDITFELAKRGEDMYLFSPHSIQEVYGVGFTEISINEKYQELVENPKIRKEKISARKFLQTLSEIQFESGYPYIMFEDTVNRANPVDGRITMSNLCSEILQVSTPSAFKADGSYEVTGSDISCNLGSLNIAHVFDSPDFSKTIEASMRSLTAVSDLSDISSVPSVAEGNRRSHAVGLGQMNLHGFFGREHIHYDSPEAVDFTNLYFLAVNYETIKASVKIAREKGESFAGFEDSAYFSGEYFKKYTEKDWATPATARVAELMTRSTIVLPTQEDWKKLAKDVKKYGMYHAYRQAVPPTGSISYINHSTSSIHPIAARIEVRKESKIGRVYYPAPHMDNDNLEYYRDAYEIGPDAIIDVYAAATQHVDQGLSLTLFIKSDATTRDLNKAYIKAWRAGIKTIYYIRVRQEALAATQMASAVNNVIKVEARKTVEKIKLKDIEATGSVAAAAAAEGKTISSGSLDVLAQMMASGSFAVELDEDGDECVACAL